MANLSAPMVRTHRSTHDSSLVSLIKNDFKRAIMNLTKSAKGAYGNDKGDMLDFAMLIALYCQELNLIRRIKYSDSKQDRPLTQMEDEEINQQFFYDWHHFEDVKEIKEILTRMKEIAEVHEYNESWYEKKFADKHRKGLPVFPYGQLMQYQCYLKGIYFHSTQNYNQALFWYTQSLRQGANKTKKYGEYGDHQTVKVISHSINYWRLQALENIEMRLSEAEEVNMLGKSKNSSKHTPRR